MINNKQTQVITLEQLEKIRYPLPESWLKAVGILRHKQKLLKRHLRKIRLEWDRRLRYDY